MATSLFGWRHLFVPAAVRLTMARAGQVKAGRQAAALRLGLELSEHAVKLMLLGRNGAARRG
jgi:hypothetical protein